MHVLKIGDQYLTASGDLSPRQTDALRIGSIDLQKIKNLRPVKMVPHGSLTPAHDSTLTDESPF